MTVFVSTATRVVPPPDLHLGLFHERLRDRPCQTELSASPIDFAEHPVNILFPEHPDTDIILEEEQAAALADPELAPECRGQRHLAL